MSDNKKKGLGRGLSALFGDAKSQDKTIQIKDSQQMSLIGNLNSPFSTRKPVAPTE